MVSARTAIVTGASGSIGAATARAFARGGMHLSLVDRDPPADSVVDALRLAGAGQIATIDGDLSDASFVSAIVPQTKERFGRVDVIVNVAGAMIFREIADMTEHDWTAMLAINFMPAALLVGAGLRELERGGAIVNVSSIHARQTTANVAGYAAAKAAMVSLTRSGAIEGRKRGIRVNAVLPGAIDTPMLWSNPMIESGLEKIEPADVGKPDTVAAAIDFLSSEQAEFVTGTELVVDGGRLASL